MSSDSRPPMRIPQSLVPKSGRTIWNLWEPQICLGSSRSVLGLSRSVQVHPGLSGSNRVRPGTSSLSGSIWVHPGPSGYVQVHSAPSGTVRVRPGMSGFVRVRPDPSGSVRVRPGPSGSVWVRLDMSGYVPNVPNVRPDTKMPTHVPKHTNLRLKCRMDYSK